MIEVRSEQDMQAFGERLGRLFRGGEVVELVGDVGAGKTTLVHGIVRGMRIDETVQSPSFTISRVYDAPNGLRLVHYDFYRLSDPGIMKDELSETLTDEKSSVVIEWANNVESILPDDRLTVAIASPTETERVLDIKSVGVKSAKLREGLL